MTDRFVEGLDSRGVVGVALMVSLFILGCGSDAVAPTDSDAPVATTLTLSATVLSLSSVGATEQLTATVLDQNGATMAGASIVWASSASTVASVSPTGLVTAVADGPATITATSGSAAGTASVTVQQVPASITLSPSSLVLAGPADTATVTASVMDAGDSEIADPDLTWSSDDEDIATVGSSGLVTAVASGSATITVTSGGQMQTLSITVEEGALTDPAGGEVSLADDAVNLVFPAGALSEDVFITAEPATGLPAGPVPIPGTAFDFGPDGIVFTEPVTLTIAYDPADVPQDVPEEELRLHKLRVGAYVLVDAGVVDVTNHTASGTIDGFSVFVILGALGVTTTSPMADGTVDVEYSQTLAATGGDGNYTWAMFNSTLLPAGLELDPETGEISGTPTATGTTDFEVEVTSAGQTATQAMSITILLAPSVTTSSPMPNGTVGVEYSETLAATGGDGNYTWAMFGSTALPAGLELDPETGEISGPPSAAGTTDFEVEVTSGSQTATKALSITIVYPVPSIRTSSPMPDGTVDVTYSRTLTARGGDGKYTWAMFNSTLPADLTLDAATGEIRGIPTAAGKTDFKVEVASAGQTATKELSIQFSTVGTLPIARFCPGDPGPESFVTFAEAFLAVIVGGTIEVCDGTHVVEGEVINAPVTIQPEPGASPVIETNVALSTFFLDGYTSGTVLIDGLTFNFSTPTGDVTSYVIRGEGTYDQLIVRNSTFNIDPASRGSVLLLTTTVTGSVTLVENTTFNGGVFGVLASGGPGKQLDVRNSQFFGTRGAALLYNETSGRIENSTFTDCFGGGCVSLSNGSQVDVVSNDFAAPDLTGVVASSVNRIVRYQSGSSGSVDDNDFGGCGEFRCVRVRDEGTDVDVTNNSFQVDPSDGVYVDDDHAVVLHELGAIGTVENNEFTGCFTSCISAETGADVLVRGNVINIPTDHITSWAIRGFEGESLFGPPSLTIEDNTIIAEVAGVVLSDPTTFRITDGGISVDGANATLDGNTIVGAAAGVSALNDGVITAGEDNFIDQSHFGVMILEDAIINLNFNDITNSFVTIFAQSITSDLDCNWWGAAAGPGGTADTPDSDIFTLWATAPIAGTDHSGCSPLADENLLIGSWNATSLTADGAQLLAGSVSFNFTFRADLTYSESVSDDTDNLFCDEGSSSCADGGTYVFTSTHLTLCDPGCDEFIEYAISGDTMTVEFVDEGVMIVFIFEKVG